MQNEILDEQFEIKKRSTLRKNLLIVESCLVFLIIFNPLFLGTVDLPYSSEILIFSAFGLAIFFLFSPLIRFLKKESTGKMSLFYFFQNLFFLPLILGFLFKIESWPYASEMMLLGSGGYILLNISAQLELKKINAPLILNIVTLGINWSIFISFLGLIFRLESWSYGFELSIIGGIFCLFFLAITIIALIFNLTKYSPLQFYLPRVIFGSLINFNVFFELFQIYL